MKNNYIYNILKNIYLKNPLSTAIEIEDVKINYKSFFEDCLNFASYINFNKYETIGIIGDYEYVNYIAIFGTLIAGKTYVPINQNLPIKKIKKILSVSKIKVLVISKIKEKKFKDINVKKID